MSINKQFSMEMDDDGLPKYSPDRNNIVAYHMYKLGLTDKLPDPEDTHTPFFRTPSWYEEKAEKERLAKSGSPAPFQTRPAKPETSDFVSQPPSGAGEKPVFPDPAGKQKPFQPDAGIPSAGENRHSEISDGTDFGRHLNTFSESAYLLIKTLLLISDCRARPLQPPSGKNRLHRHKATKPRRPRQVATGSFTAKSGHNKTGSPSS